MDRIYVMQLVRSFQVGEISRRTFLRRTTAALGSVAAANVLLAACSPVLDPSMMTPNPVVDEEATANQPAVGEMTTSDGVVSGMVAYPDPDGEELTGHLAYPEGDGAHPGIIVIQEWWGLNDHIKDVADRFAAAGYVALAPDLYHGVVTTEPDEARKEAMALGTQEAVAEIQAAIDFLKGQAMVNGRFGIVGFCMGGGLVLQTAATSADINAAVPFYGTPLSTSQATQVSAPVLSFLGSRDGIPASGYETMHTALTDAGVPNKFQLYEGAQHAFFNDTRASYNAEAAADAWQQTLNWFETYL